MFRGWLLVTLVSVGTLSCATPGQPPGGSGAREEAPKYGGTLNMRVADDPGGWDLSTFKAQPAWDGHTLAYNSLLGYRSGPDVRWDEMTLRGELAERWVVSPDARSFTFHLRRGVKFAHLPPANGRELTAEDVKWSFDYWSRTGQFKEKKLRPGVFDWMFEGLERIETPDPYTVVVRFHEPFSPFLAYAASDSNPIVPHEIYDSDGNLMDQMVGSGPFQLDKGGSQPGSRWLWKKNPDFYERGKPFIDQLHWLVVKDESAALAAFRAKQLDLLGNASLELGVTQVEEVRKGVPNAVIHQHPTKTSWHLFVNTRQGPLSDVRVRRAISQAIDRDEFIRTLTAEQGSWGLALLPSGVFTGEDIKQMIRYDPEEAKRLVVQAGYPHGLELEVTYPGKDYGEDYVTGLQLLQAQLKKVGVQLNLKSLSQADFSSRRKTGDYVVNMMQSSTYEGDLDSALFANFHSKSSKNYSGAKDAPLDQKLQAQRREPDLAKRQALIREIVRYTHAEMFYDIGILYGVDAEVWHPYLRNFATHIETRGVYPVDAWLEK